MDAENTSVLDTLKQRVTVKKSMIYHRGYGLSFCASQTISINRSGKVLLFVSGLLHIKLAKEQYKTKPYKKRLIQATAETVRK